MNISRQLEEAIEDGAELDPTDEEWLAVGAEIAASDPKKRFSAVGVRREFAKRNGVAYVKIKDETHRPDRLAKARKVVFDTVRPFLKIAKKSKGTGIEFSTSGNETEVLKDGNVVAVIVKGAGDFKTGRQRGVAFTIDVWDDEKVRSPGDYFDSLTLAKDWVRSHLA